MKNKMDGLRIVKENNTKFIAHMFNSKGDRVATFYTEPLLHNVLQDTFGLDAFEPIPYLPPESEAVRLMVGEANLQQLQGVAERNLSALSGAADNRAVKKLGTRENKEYVKGIVKYVMRTGTKEQADEHWAAVRYQTEIYAEYSPPSKDMVYSITAYPYTAEEVLWLQKHGWELA